MTEEPVRPAARGRILWLDTARSAALAGMVLFHFTFDLEMFGLLPPGTTSSGGWAVFARIVAGSFLFLAGIGLWLAQGQGGGIRWRPFLRRLAQIAAAAALITAASRIAVPGAYIFWGILHCIAAASVIGLAFLRLPAGITALAAAAALAAPRLLTAPGWDLAPLGFLGLGAETPITLDYVPLFPWLGPFLAGLALAQAAGRAGLWPRLAGGPALLARLGWPGRHSLAVYLLHQPLLVGLLWLALRLRG
ncbi:heparan-alpha-glucosaminide N-acetyltransferase [Frigidibacter oleivorans]|uniref:heparan-alpha-glucosaminide N-acetyltransferase n=1 Tax=Frigidibacter oleivorans TaxID=2487129 RepID=UPI000F8F7E26|nr:heparan-alpha-glucosaminide N-acetyltransferase [Frigidibacter oleivorans]